MGAARGHDGAKGQALVMSPVLLRSGIHSDVEIHQNSVVVAAPNPIDGLVEGDCSAEGICVRVRPLPEASRRSSQKLLNNGMDD